MKKILFGLGITIIGVLSIGKDVFADNDELLFYNPFVYVEGESTTYNSLNKINYAYSNDNELISALKDISNVEHPHIDYTLNGGAISKNKLSELETIDIETNMTSISILQYATNIKEICIAGRIADPRPFLNSKKLEEISLMSPLDSIEFLRNMKDLKTLSLDLDSPIEGEGNFYPLITDLSVLNRLNKLEEIDIYSYHRPFSKINLKKSMNKYVLVNPFILSKQFKNPEVKITSETPGFTFEDDILTWNNISPETKELQISWEFESNKTGSITFEGESVIPINWID